MRNSILALLLLTATGLSARAAVVSIPTKQCVWHSGDNLSWAAPVLDESGWRPLPAVNLQPDDAHLWVRCHASFSGLRGLAHPSIQVSFRDAYQLFVNGQPMGAAGDLSTGYFSMDSIRSFPLPASMSGPGSAAQPEAAVFALRVTYRDMVVSNPTSSCRHWQSRSATESALPRQTRRDSVLAQSTLRLTTAIYDGIVGVFGFVLLGLYFSDRSRRDLLLLSLNCFGLATIFLNLEASLALVDYPAVTYVAIYVLGTMTTGIAQPLFFFSLARRRVPLLFWLVIFLALQDHALWFPEAIFPLVQNIRLSAFYAHWAAPIGFAARFVAAFAPFIAFWPYSTITRRVRPLVAILCMVWGVQSALYFFVRLTIFNVFGIPNLAPVWGYLMSSIEPIMTLCVITALMWLLFREQRQVADERAEMAGEMQAARRVQQYLIPAELPPIPGFAIESEYRPAREVGGDFFQVLPQSSDGSLLVVVGDVAGKGVEAGMLAALIVGAIRTSAEFTTAPDRILSLLNHRLQGRGLVTCVALRIEPGGAVTLANAGHLPPYFNGKELQVEGALPLGAVPGIDYPVSRFELAEGDSLILMTDGIVEAQDAEGHLFGFERIGEILGDGISGGATLAAAAQAFGQEDDITVLTIQFCCRVS